MAGNIFRALGDSKYHDGVCVFLTIMAVVLLALLDVEFRLLGPCGPKKIEVGWKGKLLFLGQRVNRMNTVLGEGWRWAPFPFGIKMADCRSMVLKLDHLDVITEDKVKVRIDATVFYQVNDLDKFFDFRESDIKEGLDNLRDEAIRDQIFDLPLDKVLGMHATLAEKTQSTLQGEANESWGIEVLRVVVAEIKPEDKVMDDLELNMREELQKKGQLVEANHIAGLIKLFKDSDPGINLEQAVELAQLVTGKADPKKIWGINLSPDALAAAQKILGRNP